MKSLCVLVVSALLGGGAVAAQGPRVRPLDQLASAAYDRGHRQSPRFRALVSELDASDLIVHIVTTTGLPSDVAGITRLVGQFGGSRYVRIDLARSLTPTGRVAILAHELQHACELARSDAGSSTDLRSLYRVIGREAGGGAERFETVGAERMGRLVWVELGRRRRRERTVER
jgi:hypothetical protein